MSLKPAFLFLDKHSGILNLLWRILFYPFILGVFYLCTSYLNSHYVSKEEFATYKTSENVILEKINGKLDTLLLRDSANAQRLDDLQGRLTRVEIRLDSYTAIKK